MKAHELEELIDKACSQQGMADLASVQEHRPIQRVALDGFEPGVTDDSS
jgi:hypothetical protein